MSKFTKRHRQIVLNIPDEIFKKATHTLKIKGNELKDYLIKQYGVSIFSS